jgi:hypothetical protein
MKKKKKNHDINLDRRKFLKTAAATGAIATTGAIAPIATAKAASETKTAKKTWRDKPDPIPENLITDAGKFDVVVVGGGTAGLVCARVASMNGASVAVIEALPEEKYTHIGGEVGTVNSQNAQKAGAPVIDEEDFLREWAKRNLIRHNPERASYFARNSGRIFDWIIKDMSPEWMAENSHVMSCPPKPNVLQEISGWKFYYGTTIFRKMTDPIGTWRWTEVLKTHQVKSLADGAKWFFEHHAEICDVDSAGAVTGVVAKRSDGKYLRFNAKKGVALCAGDFSGDKEMVTDILDTLRNEAEARGDINLVGNTRGVLARDGSSIKLGIWAGGHIEIGPRSTMGGGDPGGGWHLQLDSNGKRFCDEAVSSMIPVPKGGVTVTIQDANWKKVLEMMPPRHGAPDTAHTIIWPARLKQLDGIKPGPPDKSKKPAGAVWGGRSMSTIVCASTIEELVDYMGCYEGETKRKALATIARYNEMCERGIDEDFGKDPRVMKVTAIKDPPFYARVSRNDGMGRGVSPGLVSTTGLDTDGDGRVLNSDFLPIKGLYAAGNNAGNRYIVVYQSPIAGISLGMAMTEGYKLGEMLANL